MPLMPLKYCIQAWKDEDLALRRLEHSFHALQTVMTKMRKLLATVIDGGTINRPEHPIGHIGRSGNLQEMPAAMARRGVFHRRAYGWMTVGVRLMTNASRRSKKSVTTSLKASGRSVPIACPAS